MSIARAFAGALFTCCIFMAVPASAASRAERADQREAHSHALDREIRRGLGPEQISSDVVNAVTSDRMKSAEARLPAYAETMSDLIVPALRESAVVLSSQPPQANSAVPLPTGVSLFGAGLLTLGLVGFVSGSQRRLAVESGFLADADIERDPAEVPLPPSFRIEVQKDRGCETRHTRSARGTIDLIADLLNEGWDIVAIRDSQGSPVDYEDILNAWHSERIDGRKRFAKLS